MKVIPLMVLWAATAIPAHAEIVTIDPDNYPAGTNLSAIAPGAWLRTIVQTGDGGRAFVLPVYSHACSVGACGAHEGVRDFGWRMKGAAIQNNWGDLLLWEGCVSGSAYACSQNAVVLRIDFDTPKDLVQIETSWWSDPPGIIAYDSDGNELFSCYGNYIACGYASTIDYTGYHETTFVVERRTADVARIVFGGVSGNARIGEISYLLE